MPLPKVSVVVPSYNHAQYLPATIQSVLDQSYVGFELIIVNDGSTDDTAEVVRKFRYPRICYIEQENRGATAARNVPSRRTGRIHCLS